MTLRTGVMMLKIQHCHHRNKLHLYIHLKMVVLNCKNLFTILLIFTVFFIKEMQCL